MRRAILLLVIVVMARQGLASAVTFTVDRFDDAVDAAPADGFCSAVGGGCTLRAAVMEANVTVAPDVIALPVGELRLDLLSGPDDQSFGDLDVTQDVTITGAGMRETTILAATGDRVFEVFSGFSLIQDLTVRGGVAASGGGLLVHPPAQVGCGRCLLIDNRATGNGGGAHVLAGAALTLGDSIVAANDAAGAGGGVHSSGFLSLNGSRVTRNRAGGAGGGIHLTGAGSSLSSSQSTIDANAALEDGGGIAVQSGGLGLINSTLSGNRGSRGGGLFLSGAVSSNLLGVTVASNTALLEGGGIWVSADSAILVFLTLLADNTAPSGPDCMDTAFENDYNLVENPAGCTGATSSLNVTGLDPELGPLANYGGATPTQELLSTASPAWNAGPATCGVSGDQRGHPRPLDGQCEIGATEFYGIVPVSLVVDAAGNGLLEPSESAVVAPVMGNLLAANATLTGQMEEFGGPDPAGFSYLRPDQNANYGSLMPGFTGSCGADCYSVSVSPLAMAERPLRHWDGRAREDTSGPLEAHWRIHVGESFADVSPGSAFYREIETLLHREATAGCGAENYCPDDGLPRRQLALLLERAYWGPFPPPFTAASQVFADVPLADPYAPWIARLAADGLTAGCAGDPDGGGPLLPRFCPEAPVRRDQMAWFAVRGKLGAGFVPDPCGVQSFEDVSIADPSCPFIRKAVQDGFLSACAPDPDGGGPLLARFCPANGVTRAQAASAFTRTFALALWDLGL